MKQCKSKLDAYMQLAEAIVELGYKEHDHEFTDEGGTYKWWHDELVETLRDYHREQDNKGVKVAHV